MDNTLYVLPPRQSSRGGASIVHKVQGTMTPAENVTFHLADGGTCTVQVACVYVDKAAGKRRNTEKNMKEDAAESDSSTTEDGVESSSSESEGTTESDSSMKEDSVGSDSSGEEDTPESGSSEEESSEGPSSSGEEDTAESNSSTN